ncbi:MAG: hypothetical protein WBW62_08150 [Solirubrobacterales bacterium]
MPAAARQMSSASALPAALPAPGRRRSPSRRQPAPTRRHQTRHLVGRTAHVVTHLPESSAVVGISRSRVWIAVIGLLLIGIVAINVLTVSYGSMASNIEADIDTLNNRNAILKSTETNALSMPRVRNAATAAGMVVPETTDVRYRSFQPGDIAAAAQRLAAEGG